MKNVKIKFSLLVMLATLIAPTTIATATEQMISTINTKNQTLRNDDENIGTYRLKILYNGRKEGNGKWIAIKKKNTSNFKKPSDNGYIPIKNNSLKKDDEKNEFKDLGKNYIKSTEPFSPKLGEIFIPYPINYINQGLPKENMKPKEYWEEEIDSENSIQEENGSKKNEPSYLKSGERLIQILSNQILEEDMNKRYESAEEDLYSEETERKVSEYCEKDLQTIDSIQESDLVERGVPEKNEVEQEVPEKNEKDYEQIDFESLEKDLYTKDRKWEMDLDSMILEEQDENSSTNSHKNLKYKQNQKKNTKEYEIYELSKKSLDQMNDFIRKIEMINQNENFKKNLEDMTEQEKLLKIENCIESCKQQNVPNENIKKLKKHIKALRRFARYDINLVKKIFETTDVKKIIQDYTEKNNNLEKAKNEILILLKKDKKNKIDNKTKNCNKEINQILNKIETILLKRKDIQKNLIEATNKILMKKYYRNYLKDKIKEMPKVKSNFLMNGQNIIYVKKNIKK